VRIETRHIEDWVIKTRRPDGEGPFPVILMLHGWTGNEKAMWVFAGRMPMDALLLAPRAPYPSPLGGYSWHAQQHQVWPWVDDFNPALEALFQMLSGRHFPEADFSSMVLVGFSQGAAMAYALALQHPKRVRALVGLSGFMPDGAEALARYRPLDGAPVFTAHGSTDRLVSVERARQSVRILEEAGAEVVYCEDDVGHKLGAGCFKGMEKFIRSHYVAK
jgi:phospholipase/carboxylesterase